MKKNKKISNISTILVIFITMLFASICISGMNLTILSDSINEESENYELNNSQLSLSSIDSNGIPICIDGVPKQSRYQFGEREMQLCNDMEGGAFIAWTDERAGNSSIYIQKVNATGHIQWEEDGVLLCNNTDNQILPKICSDGAGGAIIVWFEGVASWVCIDAYAQRFNSNGAIIWDPEGVLISDTSHYKKDYQICTDGMGGIIITWNAYHYGPYTKDGVYAQRVNATGDLKWTNSGIQICSEETFSPQICADGTGGVIISWGDSRNYDLTQTDIYIQKVNATGDIQWTSNGVALCTWGGGQRYQQMCTDGMGGAIVAYRDYLTDNDIHVRMQGINSSGSVKWRPDGVFISTTAAFTTDIQICSDDQGGAYMTWVDTRPFVYVQHINSTGWAQWTFEGIPISKYPPGKPKICQDGVGGVIITWYEGIGDWDSIDIYAQRLDAYGNMQWVVNGTAICTASGCQLLPELCSDGSGGAIIVWDDCRTDLDLYAQRVNSTGDLLWLITIEEAEAGFPFEIVLIGIIIGGIGVAIIIGVLMKRRK